MGKVIYNLTGGTNGTIFPNIEGSSISRNMFTDFNGSGDEKKTFMQSCPGIKFLKQLGIDGKCDGMFVPSTGLKTQSFQQCLFFAYKGNIYRITPKSLDHEIIGTYAIGNRVEFAESGGERAVLLWVDGQNIGAYDLKEGQQISITLPRRLDERAYIQPSHIAVVSGSIVVNDRGSSYVFYSVPYPLSQDTRSVFNIVDGVVQYERDKITVSKTDVDSGEYCFLDDYGTRQYFNAESSSDKCIAISSVGALLTLFGPSSIEFWQRGDSASYQTWQRTTYTINKEQGLEAPYSLASVNHSQFCIGTGKANSKCVLMINDTNVQKISPVWLDRILNTNETTRIIGWTYSLNNHSFYCFSIGETCYCYDIATGEWHLRSSRNFYNGKIKNYIPLYACWWDNKIIVGSSENGNLSQLDPEYFYEDFNATQRLPLLRTRQTPVITSDYKPFIIHELSVECNVGAKEDYGTPAYALLQMSNNGGYTFGNVIKTSVGRRGEYGVRAKWMNLGMTRQCVLKLTYSEPTDFVINDSSIRYTELNTGV